VDKKNLVHSAQPSFSFSESEKMSTTYIDTTTLINKSERVEEKLRTFKRRNRVTFIDSEESLPMESIAQPLREKTTTAQDMLSIFNQELFSDSKILMTKQLAPLLVAAYKMKNDSTR